jgi:RES domain-containing protein
VKLIELLPERILYRVNTPKWASSPTSGAGAAIEGGRFNRTGVEALYLSFDETTALREYQQDEPIMPPGTIAAYHVALDQVVDFSNGFVSGMWDPIWEDWNCNWRGLRMLHGICRRRSKNVPLKRH